MATVTHNETDLRLGLLNTLLTTPHRDLAAVYDVHRGLCEQDPLFYGRLAAWYADTGDIRDHKEAFVVTLCLSDFEGHRDEGCALFRQMPPHQVCNIVDFIRGCKRKRYEEYQHKGKKRRRLAKGEDGIAIMDEYGLKRNMPNSLRTELTRYLSERQTDPLWFESCALRFRKHMKRLYATKNIRSPGFKPTDFVQAALFDRKPPPDSVLSKLKALANADTPAAQAEAIIEHKIPYQVASTVISQMTPTVIYALVEVMSSQELINNLGSLKRRGAMDNPEIKALIDQKLEAAKTDKKVAALKTEVAAKASGVDEGTAAVLGDIADAQVKRRGRIGIPTALLIDASASMENAIEVGKRIAALVSAVMDAELVVYAFNTMPYPVTSEGTDLASWEKALRGIRAGGGTSIGCPVFAMLQNPKQRVEQFVIVTDGGENNAPIFCDQHAKYSAEMNVIPHVTVVKVAPSNRYLIQDTLVHGLRSRGIDHDVWDFNGDYYSLPGLVPMLSKTSKLDLLMEIMQWRIPERKAS